MTVMAALVDVEKRVLELDPRLGGEDPRTLLSRIMARPVVPGDNYDGAIDRAALAVLLAASIDRAENLNITAGDAA